MIGGDCFEADGSQIVGDPVGAGGEQFGVGRSGADGEDACACSFTGADAGGGVLDDKAAHWICAEASGGSQIWLGAGLAVKHIVGGDEMLRLRQAGGANAHEREGTGAGSGDDPAVGGKRTQEFEGAGEGNYAVDICEFAGLDFVILGVVIGVGQKLANGGHAGTPVGLAHDIFGDEAVALGPFGPDAGDGWGGVHQDSI